MLTRIAQAIASRPTLYHVIQTVAGQHKTVENLQSALEGADVTKALDVGSATGAVSRRLLRDAVGIDIDPIPLIAMKRISPDSSPVLGSIAALPFASRSFGTAVCVAVSHHLDEPTLRAGLREIARVTSDRFVFVDALRVEARWLSTILWRYDRGRFPRTREQLLEAISEHFAIERVIDYHFLHRYLLCVGRPL